MALIGVFRGKGPSGFGFNSTAEEVTEGLDLTGKTYLITGSNSGIGLETARVLMLRGATVYAGARTEAKAREALPEAIPLACELGEPKSVRAAVARVDRALDGIICNAGIMALPRRELICGYEAQFFTNHVGHFILVTGLLDRLTASGRVVLVASEAHRGPYAEGVRFDDLAGDRGYSAWGAYGQSKLCNVLMARELTRRLKPGQTAYSVHPGVIATNLTRHMNVVAQGLWHHLGPWLFAKSIPQGAATQTWCATSPAAIGANGEYCADCNQDRATAYGRDDAMARRLWEVTEGIVSRLD